MDGKGWDGYAALAFGMVFAAGVIALYGISAAVDYAQRGWHRITTRG